MNFNFKSSASSSDVNAMTILAGKQYSKICTEKGFIRIEIQKVVGGISERNNVPQYSSFRKIFRTPIKSIAVNTHLPKQSYIPIGPQSSQQIIYHHRYSVTNHGIFRKRCRKLNFQTKCLRKFLSSNHKWCTLQKSFPALPTSSNRSKILLCPSEGNRQPPEINTKGFTEQIAILRHSMPHTGSSKSRQDVLVTEPRWKKNGFGDSVSGKSCSSLQYLLLAVCSMLLLGVRLLPPTQAGSTPKPKARTGSVDMQEHIPLPPCNGKMKRWQLTAKSPQRYCQGRCHQHPPITQVLPHSQHSAATTSKITGKEGGLVQRFFSPQVVLEERNLVHQYLHLVRMKYTRTDVLSYYLLLRLQYHQDAVSC